MKAQVESIADLIKHIESDATQRDAEPFRDSLGRAKSTLEQLDRLTVKLSNNTNGSSRARKRAWMRHRSKVFRLQADLKEIRANFSAAASTQNW